MKPHQLTLTSDAVGQRSNVLSRSLTEVLHNSKLIGGTTGLGWDLSTELSLTPPSNRSPPSPWSSGAAAGPEHYVRHIGFTTCQQVPLPQS